MAKYDALRDHLASHTGAEVTMGFQEVETLVHGLPGSATTSRSFWSNDSKVQAQAWRAAGWHVASADLEARSVRFARGQVGGASGGGTADGRPKPLTHKERIEAMPTLCPTCFTAVPSTLVCDYCG